MKKIICLMFVMFLSTVANAGWPENRIYCNDNSTFHGYDGDRSYDMVEFIQEGKTWIGLVDSTTVYTKIPTLNIASCAINDNFTDAVTEKTLKTETIVVTPLSSSSIYTTFKCFCKLTKNDPLNNCYTELKESQFNATCQNGVVDLISKGRNPF